MTELTTDSVRRLVADSFATLGVAGEIRESILIEDGHYCGRRFVGPSAYALWLIAEGTLTIHAPDGEVLQDVPLTARRLAA